MRCLRSWHLPLALLATACVESITPDPATAIQPLGSPGTAVILGAAWEYPTIRVCWTQGGAPMSSLEVAAVADDLDWIEPMIHAAWEPVVGVTWTFERDCVGGYDVALDVWGDHGLGWGRTLRDAPPLGVDLRDYGEAAADRHARLRAETLRTSGRVLGLEWIAADDGEACATPFRRGCADDSPLAPAAVHAAVTLYGPAYFRMITPTGQCLMSAPSDEVEVGDCGTRAGVWPERPYGPGHFVLRQDRWGLIRRVSDDAPLRFVTTNAPDGGWGGAAFDLHAQVGASGGACLVARADEPAPRLAPCDADAHPPELWRLPHGGSGVCMVPASLEPGALVVNVVCDRVHPDPDDYASSFDPKADWYLRRNGELVHRETELCLTPLDLAPVGSLLTLEPCQGLTRQRFMLHAAFDAHTDGVTYGIDAPATEVDAPTAVGPAAPRGLAPLEHRRFTFRTTL